VRKSVVASLGVLVLLLALAAPALADGHLARVRVVHASPDAPAVDVWVNDAVAFSGAPFKGITEYAELPAATYNVKVVPAGEMSPVVIDTDLSINLEDREYTVVAVGKLADIEPVVLVDNNAQPASGFAHVRFFHASPDAPAVDIAVKDGPVLFENILFKNASDYLPVGAGKYDLEVRLAGTDTVALEVPGVMLEDGSVYTVFAMGLAGGSPSLMAVPSVDAAYGASAAPALLPESGGASGIATAGLAIAGGLGLVGTGLALGRKRR
jgi:hypothetical protein